MGDKPCPKNTRIKTGLKQVKIQIQPYLVSYIFYYKKILLQNTNYRAIYIFFNAHVLKNYTFESTPVSNKNLLEIKHIQYN